MRWRFADQNNQAEASYRLRMTEKFDNFWRSFEANIEKIDSENVNKRVLWVTKELPKVHKDFMWEFSPKIDNVCRFAITPDGNFYLHPMIASMLERAPKVEGFNFMPYRSPVEAENVTDLVTGRTGEWVNDLRIQATVNDRNAIDLEFISTEFGGEDSERYINYCFILCEVILGQQILEEWIGELTPRVFKPQPMRLFRSFLKGRDAATNTIDISNFRSTINDLLQSKIISKLPEKPLWQIDSKILDKSGGLLEFTNEGSRRVTCSSVTPNVILGALSNPRCFTSNRFSRFEETFCYLKIDESGVQDVENSLDRGEMENAFDAALKKAGVGCVTGGGWGPVYNFIDLALVDVESAIPVLREVAEQIELPKLSWLRFLDAKLTEEWVGMYADTPEADMSPGW